MKQNEDIWSRPRLAEFWGESKTLEILYFYWGCTISLKINDFRLMVYVCESKRVNHVYFDEVVISRQYIRPLAAETAVEYASWGQIIRRGWWNWR